ncbi:unnamed protein product [Euphydryas editha]|uniref:Uncharacterized protein n=1 Tax=Euphydryas editha TaxID=104508 RepID=A0AAU9V0M1_EUPED|nr:unnamed protein product [Euphydryas editha]
MCRRHFHNVKSIQDDTFSEQVVNNYQAHESIESPGGESKTRGPGGRDSGAGRRGRRGSAQVAARIDRPGCALQCHRRDQTTHLLAELYDRVRIEYYAVQQTPLSSETRTHCLSRDFCLCLGVAS